MIYYIIKFVISTDRLPASKKSETSAPSTPSYSTLRRASEVFLEHLRDHENMDRKLSSALDKSKLLAAAKKAQEQKKLETQLAQNVEDADKCISKAEEELNKVLFIIIIIIPTGRRSNIGLP